MSIPQTPVAELESTTPAECRSNCTDYIFASTGTVTGFEFFEIVTPADGSAPSCKCYNSDCNATSTPAPADPTTVYQVAGPVVLQVYETNMTVVADLDGCSGAISATLYNALLTHTVTETTIAYIVACAAGLSALRAACRHATLSSCSCS